MKFNFKKVTAIATGALMTGMTIGTALAAGVAPSDLGGSNFAIVYGANANSKDVTAATNVDTALKSQVDGSGSVIAGSDAVDDDEITLGAALTSGTISTPLKNNKLSGLVKEKLSWDDGNGADEYDVHEEITLGTMNILTTLDDKKLNGVALSNENAVEYKLVFDDALNISAVGDAEADSLYLTILGQEYEITDMATTSVTVTTSSEVSMAIDQTYTLSNGKTVTLVDVFSDSVEVMVDGKSEVIDKGSTEKVNGVRIKVSSLGYHDNAPETSKAILKIGEDISKTYASGDEYIGEDKDDPLWVWDISSLNESNGYIGVKYNAKIDSANDEIAGDSIKYVGEGYILPGDYAAVTLDSITDAAYQDLKIYFEDSEDLFNSADGSTAMLENKPVLVIEGENTDTITVAGHETSKVYLYYNNTANYSNFQAYYLDVDGDYTPTNKMRLANASIVEVANDAVAETAFATIEIGDTNLKAKIKEAAGVATFVLTNDDDSNSPVLNLTLGGTALNESRGAGTLEYLGSAKEDAEAGDVYFQGADVSTEDYDYMDHYGIYISKDSKVQDDTDNDEVYLSIPEEQVYAKASVSLDAVVSGSSAGNILYTDDEAGYSGKALVIVGGSAVNSAAAEALGVAAGTSGADFTAATGVSAGQFLIKKATLGGKTAIVVAGYEADDTFQAAQYLINNGVKEGVYTTATSEVVTA